MSGPRSVRRGVVSACLLAGASLLLAATSAMGACYGGNEGAWSAFIGYTNITGTQSDVNLTIASPLSGAAIVHPLQVKAPGADTDFLGWGTYKARIVVGNCPIDVTGWNVYADGLSYNVYFCRVQGELPDDPSYHNFRLSFDNCPHLGRNRWVFYLNGTGLTCNAMGNWGRADGTGAGGESVGTTSTQTIDVYYKDTKYRHPTLGWQLWDSRFDACADSGYRIRRGAIGTPAYWHDFFAERT